MRADAVHFEKERGVTEVSVRRGIAHVTVSLPPENVGAGRLELLQRLAAANIPVFLIKLLPKGLSFALRESVVEAGAVLLAESGHPHQLRPDLALITIYAGAMRDLSGVMASIYEALISENIRVWQTGDAHNAVHCLVPGPAADTAIIALRETFALHHLLDADDGEAESPEGLGSGVL
ncbi:MAG: ACT domain-containing protein [Capsulimonadales bacterium]|nr:ACT domain-containing protein [Capsulimonadales bacterium]